MSSPYDLVLHARRAVIGTEQRAATIAVRDGVIAEIAPWDTPLSAARTLRLRPDEVLLPGLVDSHVHVNEPGRTEWEGWASASRAAAAGGITTIVDMPLNSSPTTCSADALAVKRRAAAKTVVDAGFWGGAVPESLGSLHELHAAGVWGFKCFLLDSGIDEFRPLDAHQLELAMREIAALGSLLVVHAEDASTLAAAPAADGPGYGRFVSSRPASSETRAIATVIAAARATGCRTHIVHLSAADALPLLAQARADGVPLTVETCPHYLLLAAEDVPDGATQYKCCPPIRDEANRVALWEGLESGTIDLVVSDHSPCTPDLKHLDSGDFAQAWGGIASLQLSVSIVWTAAAARGLDPTHLATWMARRPAELLGLPGKGVIAVGADADFCTLAPDESYVVDAARLHHRHALSPYDGRTLRGVVRSTWLRGRQIADGSDVLAPAGNGRHLLRKS